MSPHNLETLPQQIADLIVIWIGHHDCVVIQAWKCEATVVHVVVLDESGYTYCFTATWDMYNWSLVLDRKFGYDSQIHNRY